MANMTIFNVEHVLSLLFSKREKKVLKNEKGDSGSVKHLSYSW